MVDKDSTHYDGQEADRKYLCYIQAFSFPHIYPIHISSQWDGADPHLERASPLVISPWKHPHKHSLNCAAIIF